MRKLSVTIMVLILVSCSSAPVPGPAIITSKSTTVYSQIMCVFEYKGLDHSYDHAFEDSCKLYKIGDTIVGSKKELK